MREGLKAWTVKRRLTLESPTDENEPPSKCQTRAAKVQYRFCALLLFPMFENLKSISGFNIVKSHAMNFFIGCHFTRGECPTWKPPV